MSGETSKLTSASKGGEQKQKLSGQSRCEDIATWRQSIRQQYPELTQGTHFVPPLHFLLGDYAGSSTHRFPSFPISTPSGSKFTKPSEKKLPDTYEERMLTSSVPESGVLDGQQRFLYGLHDLAERTHEVMMVLSQRKFGQYVNKPSYSAAADALIGQSANIKERRLGETDVLIINKQFGLITGEIRDVQMTEDEKDISIVATMKEIITKLNESEGVLKQLASFMPDVNVIKTLILPSVTSDQLSCVLSKDVKTQEDLCRCLGVKTLTEALELCLLADDTAPSVSKLKTRPGSLTQMESWWLRLLKQTSYKVDMMDSEYEHLVAMFCGPATNMQFQFVTPPRLGFETGTPFDPITGYTSTKDVGSTFYSQFDPKTNTDTGKQSYIDRPFVKKEPDTNMFTGTKPYTEVSEQYFTYTDTCEKACTDNGKKPYTYTSEKPYVDTLKEPYTDSVLGKFVKLTRSIYLAHHESNDDIFQFPAFYTDFIGTLHSGETHYYPEPVSSETLNHPEPVSSETVNHPEPVSSETVTYPEPDSSETDTHPEPVSSETVTHPEPVSSEIVNHPEPVSSEIVNHPEPVSNEIVIHPEPVSSETVNHPEPVSNEIVIHPEPVSSKTVNHPEPVSNEIVIHPEPVSSETDNTSDPLSGESPSIKPIFSETWQMCQTFTSSTGQMQGKDSDIVLFVPEGAIEQQDEVIVHGAVCTDLKAVHQELRLEDSETIISPVVEYHTDHLGEFQKPVNIYLPLFIPSITSPSESLRVYRFFKTENGSMDKEQLLYKTLEEEKTAGKSGKENERFFYLTEHRQICVVALHFCGFVCSCCNREIKPGPLCLRLYGVHRQRKQREAIISLYVWDERLAITDFEKKHVCGQEQDLKFIIDDSLDPVPSDTNLEFGACLELTKEDEEIWKHREKIPGFQMLPSEARRTLQSMFVCSSTCVILSDDVEHTQPKQGNFNTNRCYERKPVRIHWSLENKPGYKPDNWFRCAVQVGYVKGDKHLQFIEIPQSRTLSVFGLELEGAAYSPQGDLQDDSLEKEYNDSLVQLIRPDFVMSVDPKSLICFLPPRSLSTCEEEMVLAELLRNGSMSASYQLLKFLSRHDNWVQNLSVGLRHDGIRLEHLADKLEQHKVNLMHS